MRAQEDLQFWKKNDPQKIVRIKKLCKEITKKPFAGIGKPEPLKFDLVEYWSRRIDRTHRLVYTIKNDVIIMIACRYHY